MSSERIRGDATNRSSSTHYSAIPIPNVDVSGTQVTTDNHRNILRRLMPTCNAIIVTLMLVLTSSLIGHAGPRWSYNRFIRKTSYAKAMRSFEEHGKPPYVRTDTGQVIRKDGTISLIYPSSTKDLYSRDGKHRVVTGYTAAEADITSRKPIAASGSCPKGEKVTSCACAMAAWGCLEAGSGTIYVEANGCHCEYAAIAIKCRRLGARHRSDSSRHSDPSRHSDSSSQSGPSRHSNLSSHSDLSRYVDLSLLLGLSRHHGDWSHHPDSNHHPDSSHHPDSNHLSGTSRLSHSNQASLFVISYCARS